MTFQNTGKVMRSTPAGGSENSFSEYFDLRTLLRYLHFIQVTNPLIIAAARYYGYARLARMRSGMAQGIVVMLEWKDSGCVVENARLDDLTRAVDFRVLQEEGEFFGV